MISALLIAAAVVSGPGGVEPCNRVDRSLSAEQRALVAPVVERQLKKRLDAQAAALVRIGPADVLAAFRVAQWQIISVDSHATDDPYVFYADDPIRSDRYVTIWAGAATASEAPEIERWVVANAPGIPRQLAACFAWYVTEGLNGDPQGPH